MGKVRTEDGIGHRSGESSWVCHWVALHSAAKRSRSSLRAKPTTAQAVRRPARRTPSTRWLPSSRVNWLSPHLPEELRHLPAPPRARRKSKRSPMRRNSTNGHAGDSSVTPVPTSMASPGGAVPSALACSIWEADFNPVSSRGRETAPASVGPLAPTLPRRVRLVGSLSRKEAATRSGHKGGEDDHAAPGIRAPVAPPAGAT